MGKIFVSGSMILKSNHIIVLTLPDEGYFCLFRPDKDRFDHAYLHSMLIHGKEERLTINQARYSSRGFASTGKA